jgi:hypothetical protein
MTQRNRTKIEVETLEDRVTPAAFGAWPSQICALKTTLHAKIGSLPSSFSSQLASLKAKIHSLNGLNGHFNSNGNSNGNCQTNSRICSLLDAAYAKLVSLGAPQAALNKVIALQAKFGCPEPITT